MTRIQIRVIRKCSYPRTALFGASYLCLEELVTVKIRENNLCVDDTGLGPTDAVCFGGL